MRSILVPIEESEVLPSILQCSVLIARRFGSYLEGLHVRHEIHGSIAAAAVMSKPVQRPISWSR